MVFSDPVSYQIYIQIVHDGSLVADMVHCLGYISMLDLEIKADELLEKRQSPKKQARLARQLGLLEEVRRFLNKRGFDSGRT